MKMHSRRKIVFPGVVPTAKASVASSASASSAHNSDASCVVEVLCGFRAFREEYGAQPPIEILRQWFDQGGWFDRKELTFRKIIDMTMVCSMGLPGGGRCQS